MKRIKRIILWFRLYDLDITIKGQDECLLRVVDVGLALQIDFPVHYASAQVTR